MKKISILTFSLSIMLLIGASCSMVDEPDMPQIIDNSIDDAELLAIEASNDTTAEDSIFQAFILRADSVFNNDPYFNNYNTQQIKARSNNRSSNTKYVDIKTDYYKNSMFLQIPVSVGRICYSAVAGTKGIPNGPIHIQPNGNNEWDCDFLCKEYSRYIEMRGWSVIIKSLLGVNYSTITTSYYIEIDHPRAMVAEYSSSSD